MDFCNSPGICDSLTPVTMGTSTIVAWVIVLALARLLYNHARLNSLPGPFYAGLSDFWRIDAQSPSKYGRRLVELHAKYGTIVRVGPNSVSVSNPAAILPVQAPRTPRQVLFNIDIGVNVTQ